jgi:superfamily II DNA or RNA helicase
LAITEQLSEIEERHLIEKALKRIPELCWQLYLESEEGQEIARCISSAEEALEESFFDAPRKPRRPVSEIIDLLGTRILADRKFGPWVRFQLLCTLKVRQWHRLEVVFEEIASSEDGSALRRCRTQESVARLMARKWRSGGRWASAFCDVLGLPESLARGRGSRILEDEEVLPAEPLPPLHDFQLEVYRSLRELLGSGDGHAGMLSLPTGAGKTRVTVEAICDHIAENCRHQRAPRVLWISQSAELQEQAWECFRQVWQVPPSRSEGKPVRRGRPLKLVRLWGGRDMEDIDFPDQPAVLIASVDQLASWVRRAEFLTGVAAFVETIRKQNFACVVVDEAHSLMTAEYRSVLVALRIRAKEKWRMLASAPPFIGLSATPWRKNDSESRSLLRFFGKRLLRPESLGELPIATLQERSILSRVTPRKLKVSGTPAMTARQWKKFNQFRALPPEYLELLGRESHRNGKILNELLRLPASRRVLVFACSVEHAKLLVLALNKAVGTNCAALVTAKTPKAERYDIIDRFRSGGGLRFLCNVGVLTLGFDAPKTDVVCITRPTWSAVAYEQMVGRGLRGPLNGGTRKCKVLDVQDEGLPEDVQSYSRVLEMWDG